MILCKQNYIYNQFYKNAWSYIYVGEGNMNNNYLEDKELTTYLSLFKLSEFIDSKVQLIKNYSTINKSFCGKALFLVRWMKESKTPIFKEITANNNFKTVKPDKYDSIYNRINKYFSYFNIIEDEEDEEDVYEQMFDTLIQIPTEIYNFLEIKIESKQAKFVNNRYETGNVRKSSNQSHSELNIAA